MKRSETRRLPLWAALPIAAALVAATLLLRLHLYTSDQSLLIVFVLPTMISAFLGGLAAGLVATFLSGAAVGYFLLSPLHILSLSKAKDHVQLIVFLVTGAVVTLLIAGLDRSRRRIARDKSLLGATLASIGDAVIVADNDGRIAFLNAEAERLTHWTGSVALGRRLRGVFTIKNEETGEPAESPVDKVLRLGTVVGFSNRTVLIARDGQEVPIDGSSAPVRERDGTVHGAVLVFRDMSERRRAEERAGHFASSAELSPEPVMEGTRRSSPPRVGSETRRQ